METFLDGKVRLLSGDCVMLLPALDADSFDACICDPPYHLASIVKRFGKEGSAAAKSDGATGVYKRASAGFMGKAWDGGDVAFRPETWAAVLRVLKPGAHIAAFGAPKNAHRLTCAIEDAGFEIRDVVMWLFGSGFPKSHDVSKAIDRAAGAEREVLRTAKYRDIRNGHGRGLGDGINAAERDGPEYIDHAFTAPATAAAREWQGWGSALKPGYEPIIIARKPLSEGTVAANVLKWGTGALNIDGCRVASGADYHELQVTQGGNHRHDVGLIEKTRHTAFQPAQGRWPANVAHDGSDEVVGAFPDAPGQQATVHGNEPSNSARYIFNGLAGRHSPREPVGDSGSAARFFYCAKATADDRAGSKHPTVKPIALLRWLVRLMTAKGGLILDPFAGTGTVSESALYEGARSLAIELEAVSQEDFRRRMAMTMMGPEERARVLCQARGEVAPFSDTELAGAAA